MSRRLRLFVLGLVLGGLLAWRPLLALVLVLVLLVARRWRAAR